MVTTSQGTSAQGYRQMAPMRSIKSKGTLTQPTQNAKNAKYVHIFSASSRSWKIASLEERKFEKALDYALFHKQSKCVFFSIVYLKLDT